MLENPWGILFPVTALMLRVFMLWDIVGFLQRSKRPPYRKLQRKVWEWQFRMCLFNLQLRSFCLRLVFCFTKLVILIAWYRPHFGPEGEKWLKNGFWPHRMAIFPFFSCFPGGAKIHFLAIFFPFRAGGPKWGLYQAITIAMQSREGTVSRKDQLQAKKTKPNFNLK